ncbi:MAG: hypothetical protein C4B56_05940 [Candidatus Methanophagaceae archaeon]|nr:MAG: hypothetical protein C4B56_05940 [Methanophagales archaeon]
MKKEEKEEQAKERARQKQLRADEDAVSPVIGVIMMIAIVVIIAAVVAAFAYGIIGGVNKAPSTALVVEGVKPGTDVKVTVYHHGGDTIVDAFKAANASDASGKWNNLEVRLNGATVGSSQIHWLKMNNSNYTAAWKPNFEPGDQISMEFGQLNVSDSIAVVHVPSDSILQRVTVT